MRVRHGDPGNPAQLANPLDRGVVDQAHAVPQHVPVRRPDQQGPLTDAQPGLDADPDQAVLDVPDLRAEPFPPKLGQRGPPLARPAHVLALVLADGAAIGRPVSGRMLNRAGPAGERPHGRLHGPSNYATWSGSPWWGTWITPGHSRFE